MTRPPATHRSLRLIVLATTGQDVRECNNCGLCSAAIGDDAAGSLEQWVQWLIANDERALHFLPAHSAPVLQAAQRVCINRFDFQKALNALHAEAMRRGGSKQEG